MAVVTRSCPKCGRRFPDSVSFCGEDGTITIQDQDAADRDPRLGAQLGGYIVVACVADGAMGRVYEGRHPQTKSRVAIKVLHADVSKDPVSVERFRREYETAGEMEHPGIIKVLEFGETPDSSYFMTMEYLEGEELRHVLQREGPQPADRVIRVISQVASALEYAHSFGFIHRDLKPDNVFLCASPQGDVVRILDFGSVKLQVETGAKLTALGTTLGSPYYMSPEQARGALDVDQRSDVFAMSAILYEMLTGQIAFGGGNLAQILVKILNESPPAPSTLVPSCPQSVDDVVDKGLRKDKERRFPSVVALAQAMIEAYGLSGPVATWANAGRDEIAWALEQVQPKAPKPFGVDSMHPASGPAAAPAAAPGAMAQPHSAHSVPYVDEAAESRGRKVSSSSGLGTGALIGIGLAFVFVVGGVVAFLMR